MRFVSLWLLSWFLELLAVVYFIYVLLAYVDFIERVSSSAGTLLIPELGFGDLLRTGVYCLAVVVGAEASRVLIATERHFAQLRYSVDRLREDLRSARDYFQKGGR